MSFTNVSNPPVYVKDVPTTYNAYLISGYHLTNQQSFPSRAVNVSIITSSYNVDEWSGESTSAP